MGEDNVSDQLLSRAAAGDGPALAELFERFRPRLLRMVELRMDARIKARFDAADVVQEAFVDVARRLPTYATKSDIPFFLWLRIVTGDRLGKFHRLHLGAEKRAAYREVTASAGGQQIPDVSSAYLASQLAGQFTSVDRPIKREEARGKLHLALNSMNRDDRELIAMRHFEELSTAEIAAILGMTQSGVRKRYRLAIQRLSAAVGSSSDFSVG